MKKHLALFTGLAFIVALIGCSAETPLGVTPTLPSPTVARSTATSLPTTAPSLPETATLDPSPLVTPPGPSEPTVPPAALQMQAAPSVTPITALPEATRLLPPTPTPTLVSVGDQDDAPMVDVPAGLFTMGLSRQEADDWFRANSGAFAPLPALVYDQVPQLRVFLDTFSIDQLEVTNIRYRRCIEIGPCSDSLLINSDYPTSAEFDQHPAVVTWYQARTYCGWVGKRLPTEAEWEKAARGADGRYYPWGNEFDAQHLNQPRTFQQLEAVGQHPSGTSPYGALNMGGNAREWVGGNYGPYPGNKVEMTFASLRKQDLKISRGAVTGIGSTTSREVESGNNIDSQLTGFRCVAGPEPVALAEAVQEILTWPALEPVAEPDLSQAVYIPAGTFVMGSDSARGTHGRPARVFDLDAYFIDRHEVTVGEFIEFLNALGAHRYACHDHHCVNIIDGDFFGAGQVTLIKNRFEILPDQAEQPVIFQTWHGSQAYCRWRGGRLPTSAEWEKAARGADGRRYPWGDEWRPEAADVSPYGVVDMLGSVPEWVYDWLDIDYLARAPFKNPSGPTDSSEFDSFRTVRGYLSIDNQQAGLTKLGPGVDYGQGFRCVYPQ